MPHRGRPPQPGTAEEKAAIRREKVRLYVKAHRARKKASIASSPDSTASLTSNAIAPIPGPDAITRAPKPEVDENVSPKADPLAEDDVEEVETVETNDSRPWIMIQQQPHRASQGALTLGLSGDKELAFAIMGSFRVQFLPAFVRIPSLQGVGSELVTPCSPWVTNAYEIGVSQESGAMRSCLLAVGLALNAAQHGDERLKVASLKIYRKALRQVRKELLPLTNGQATNFLGLYLTCLAASMFELLHDGFSENIMQHIRGAMSLVQFLPQDEHVDLQLGDLLLEDFCMWEITFALKYRYPSPLRALRRQKGARAYKVAGDLNRSTHNLTVMGDLLDCADEISTVMSRVDALKSLAPSLDKHVDLQLESAKLVQILKSFDTWDLQVQTRFGPVFEPTGTFDKSGTPMVQFASYEAAAAWLYFLTFQACAIETHVEVLDELLLLKQHQNLWSSSPDDSKDSMTMAMAIPIREKLFENPPAAYSSTESLNEDATKLLEMQHHSISESLTLYRSRLRSITLQLLEAIKYFLPIPKGIIGSSLALYPLDRVKATVKREIATLQNDLAHTQKDDLKTAMEVLDELDKMSQCAATSKAVEQELRRQGMPSMPET